MNLNIFKAIPLRFLKAIVFVYFLFLSSPIKSQSVEEFYNLLSDKMDQCYAKKEDRKIMLQHLSSFIDSLTNKNSEIKKEEFVLMHMYAEATTDFLYSKVDDAHKKLTDAVRYHTSNQLKPSSICYSYGILFGINVTFKNYEKAAYYSDELMKSIPYIKTKKLKLYAIKSLSVIGHLKNDTSMILKSINQRLALIDNKNAEDYYSCKLDQFIILNKQDSISYYGQKVIGLSNNFYIQIYYYRLLNYYNHTNKFDSIFKYATLLYNDDYAQENIKYKIFALECIKKVKLHFNDTIGFKNIQLTLDSLSSYYSIENTSSIINRESKSNISVDKKKPFWLSILISISIVSLLLFVYIRFRPTKKVSLEEKTEPVYSIPEDQKNKIKEVFASIIRNKEFLDRNISLKTICENYAITNESNISKYIKIHFNESFPNWLANIRFEYYKKNKETEFYQLTELEISSKLGFGSLKTFRRHLARRKASSIQDL